MNMKLFHWIGKGNLAMILGLVLALLLSGLADFGQDCQQLEGEVLRLHILANSDSPADQTLKLEVRDRILRETQSLFGKEQSLEEAKAAAEEALPLIQRVAQEEVWAHGVQEPVSAQLCVTRFTTRQYGDLYLPAGEYQAVRVTIGEGLGHNWWCVMYPPLCVPSSLTQELSETQDIQKFNQQPLFRPKLAIVEVLEGLLHPNV